MLIIISVRKKPSAPYELLKESGQQVLKISAPEKNFTTYIRCNSQDTLETIVKVVAEKARVQDLAGTLIILLSHF